MQGSSPPGRASPEISSQNTCPLQSILTWVISANNTRTPGPPKTIEGTIQPPIIHQKTNNIFELFQPTNTIFLDQTGAFPIISSRGYRYIMFVYIYNINAILMRCLKTKAGAEHLQTFKDVHTLLLHRGLQPRYFRMDNECSAPIKNFITDNDMELQMNFSERQRQSCR